jgi:hypothetical protein
MDWWIIAALIGAVFLLPTAYAGLIGAPWAPTRLPSVRRAFDDIGIGRDDLVVDLGAGDGSILREAVSRGARAFGYELSPVMWLIGCTRMLRKKRISIHYGNFFNKKLPSDTTVVFLFLMPKHMERVGKYIVSQNLTKNTLVLSYAFPFKNVSSTRTYREPKCAPLYLYEVGELRSSFDPAA